MDVLSQGDDVPANKLLKVNGEAPTKVSAGNLRIDLR